MKNTIEINSDGVNVYATLRIKANIIGQILLLILIIGLILGFIFIVSSTDSKEMGEMIIPIILMLAFIIGVPLRYLIWNIYGREHLIINTKTISYSYDYGVLKTTQKTLHFYRLTTTFEPENTYGDEEKGKLIFWNYLEDTHLPEVLFTTSIILRKDELQVLNNEITELFNNEFLDSHGFTGFSMN